jgi:hypothetical protein
MAVMSLKPVQQGLNSQLIKLLRRESNPQLAPYESAAQPSGLVAMYFFNSIVMASKSLSRMHLQRSQTFDKRLIRFRILPKKPIGEPKIELES